MRCATRLLEKPYKAADPGHVVARASATPLVVTAPRMRAAAVMVPESMQHGIVNPLDRRALALQPNQKVARRSPDADDPARRQTGLLQPVQKLRKEPLERIPIGRCAW